MTDTLYDNPAHWKAMHERFSGSLKAVGRSGLSETYNRYKYRTEEETFVDVLVRKVLPAWSPEQPVKVLDIGAGIGYWMQVVQSVAATAHVPVRFTALDLSEKALQALALNFPDTECLLENAGLVNSKLLYEKFDLVMANYCLHHITHTDQFNNALQLAIQSVKSDGFLMLMDCFIDLAYSPYYLINKETYAGSGLSRPLAQVDQACEENNMRRVFMAQPISYLMNNVLEDKSESAYRRKQWIWKILHRMYKSEQISRWLMPIIFPVDRFLKNHHQGFSTRLILYQKQRT